MKFIVKSRSDIHNAFHPGGRSVLISITDPDKDHCIPSGKYVDMLCVKFHDADRQSPGIQLIDDNISSKIIDFVVKNLNVDSIIVNCEAGISRSAGVAAALSRIFNGDDSELVRAKPFFNRKVYRTILETWEYRLVESASCGDCPDCGSPMVDGHFGSGIRCSNDKCGYWFCY